MISGNLFISSPQTDMLCINKQFVLKIKRNIIYFLSFNGLKKKLSAGTESQNISGPIEEIWRTRESAVILRLPVTGDFTVL